MRKNNQQYAMKVERIICKALLCERGGFNGIADADTIRGKPYATMLEALDLLPQNKRSLSQISDFAKQYESEKDKEIDKILDEPLQHMIGDFEKLMIRGN